MTRIIQVHIFKGEKQYVAECLDLPVVTQGKTLDELAQNLRSRSIWRERIWRCGKIGSGRGSTRIGTD